MRNLYAPHNEFQLTRGVFTARVHSLQNTEHHIQTRELQSAAVKNGFDGDSSPTNVSSLILPQVVSNLFYVEHIRIMLANSFWSPLNFLFFNNVGVSGDQKRFVCQHSSKDLLSCSTDETRRALERLE